MTRRTLRRTLPKEIRNKKREREREGRRGREKKEESVHIYCTQIIRGASNTHGITRNRGDIVVFLTIIYFPNAYISRETSPPPRSVFLCIGNSAVLHDNATLIMLFNLSRWRSPPRYERFSFSLTLTITRRRTRGKKIVVPRNSRNTSAENIWTTKFTHGGQNSRTNPNTTTDKGRKQRAADNIRHKQKCITS